MQNSYSPIGDPKFQADLGRILNPFKNRKVKWSTKNTVNYPVEFATVEKARKALVRFYGKGSNLPAFVGSTNMQIEKLKELAAELEAAGYRLHKHDGRSDLLPGQWQIIGHVVGLDLHDWMSANYDFTDSDDDFVEFQDILAEFKAQHDADMMHAWYTHDDKEFGKALDNFGVLTSQKQVTNSAGKRIKVTVRAGWKKRAKPTATASILPEGLRPETASKFDDAPKPDAKLTPDETQDLILSELTEIRRELAAQTEYNRRYRELVEELARRVKDISDTTKTMVDATKNLIDIEQKYGTAKSTLMSTED